MSEWHHQDRGPVTEEMLLRAVNILADIVEQQGSAFRPLYHDLRQQLAAFRLNKQADAATAAIAARRETEVA